MKTLVYIAGVGRSGSTLLERMLGELPGAVAVGEACFLGDRGLGQGAVCSCGAPVDGCELWSPVLAELGTAEERAELVRRLRGFHEFGTNPGGVRQALAPFRPASRGRLEAYRATLQGLYQAIATVSGADTIVDSSKFPPYGRLLSSLDGFRTVVLHLVRDSRGVSFSWTKEKVYSDSGGEVVLMRRHGLLGSIARWWVYNLGAWLLGRARGVRYVRLRYEDLVRDPEAVFAELCRELGKSVPDGLFVGPRRIELGRAHQLAGNPVRFARGPVDIRADDGWKNGLSGPQKALVYVSTRPLGLLMGY